MLFFFYKKGNNMQLNKLLSNYQILVTTTYNSKPMYICLDRLSFSVEFFQVNGNDFDVLCKSEASLFLSKFKKSHPLFQMISFSNSLKKNLKQVHINATAGAIRSLQSFTKDLPIETQRKIADTVDKTQFVSLMEAPEFIKTYYTEQGFSAMCIPSEQMIVLTNQVEQMDSLISIEKTLIHEFLHCCTHNSEQNTDGFVDYVNFANQSATLNVMRGEYFNEAMTEFFAEKIIEEKYKTKTYTSNYIISQMALTVLLNQLDFEKVKQYYFEGSNRKISEYLCENFYVKNLAVVSRMLALFDLATKSYLVALKNNASDPLVEDSYVSLYQFIIDLTINKFVHENKNLETLNLEYFFPCNLKNNLYNSLKQNAKLNNYLESAKLCVKYMPQCIAFDKKFDYMEYKSAYLEMLEYLAYARPLPKQKKYDMLKNFETFSSIMFEHNNGYANNKVSRINVKNCLKIICNLDNNYLPQNKAKQIFLINQFVNSPNTQKIDPLEYLSVDTALEVCKNNTKLFHYLCEKYTGVLLIKIDELSSSQKQDEYFVNNMFKFVLKQTPREAKKFLINYYDSFANDNISLQQKFVEQVNVKLQNTHLHDVCSEVLSYISNNNEKTY